MLERYRKRWKIDITGGYFLRDFNRTKKDSIDRSKKDCFCGRHSANDAKKSRLIVRKLRRFVNSQVTIDPEYQHILEDNFWDLI